MIKELQIGKRQHRLKRGVTDWKTDSKVTQIISEEILIMKLLMLLKMLLKRNYRNEIKITVRTNKELNANRLGEIKN